MWYNNCYFGGVIIKNLEESTNIYFKEMSNYKILSAKEEKELAIKMKNGDKKAREIFINSNTALVVHIAKDYKNNRIVLIYDVWYTSVFLCYPICLNIHIHSPFFAVIKSALILKYKSKI